MKKPSSNEINSLLKEICEPKKKLFDINGNVNQMIREIRSIQTSILKKSAVNSLKSVPVEDLNSSGEGINIQALKGANINFLSDFDGMTKADITRINGIGDVMAEKILETLAKSRETISKSQRFRINSEDVETKDIQTLLTNVYFLINEPNIFNDSSALKKSVGESFNEDVEETKKLNSMIWLFSKKSTKETRLAAYDRLCTLRDSGFVSQVQNIETRYAEALRKSSTSAAVSSFKANTAPFYALIDKLCGSKSSGDEAEVFGLPQELVNSINDFDLDTTNMVATLRGYQEFGTKYILNQKKVLLGDEMGLGKTMQAIAAMAHLKSKGLNHFIVVCPVSVMVNWGREISKHSKLTTMRIHGEDREKEFDEFINNGGIAVTTFETITKLPLDKLTSIDMLTVDEAHYVKNPSAQRTQALQKIASVSENVLLMTGTPLENKVEEMIFLISMLREELSKELSSMITLNKAPEFRMKIAPVYLRRVREDVLTELPEKIESEEWCDLTPAEKKLYIKSLTERNPTLCRRVSFDVENIEDSSKIARLVELCEEAKNEGRKIVIFSFFLGILDRVQEALGDRCFGRITGAIPSEERQSIIDEFANKPDGSVMLSQIIAGGVGLNIQCASVVIICEPQWKPSIENQAISRCYRMGQSKSVLVYRLLSADTVDEEILKLLKEKSNVFDEFADESEIGEVKKSMDEIIEKQRQAYGIVEDSENNAQTSNTEVEKQV